MSKPWSDWPDWTGDCVSYVAACKAVIGDAYDIEGATPDPISHWPVDTWEEAQAWRQEIKRTHPARLVGTTFTFDVDATCGQS